MVITFFVVMIMNMTIRTAKEAAEQWDTMRKKMLEEGKTNEEVKTTLGPRTSM